MSDTRTRELERRWRETSAGADRLAYASELKRAGRYEDIARVYQPILEETPSTHQEYLRVSPLTEKDTRNLEELIQHQPLQGMRIWHIGSSVVRPDYNDVDLLIEINYLNFDVADFQIAIQNNISQFSIDSVQGPYPQIVRPGYAQHGNLALRIQGTYKETHFDLCMIPHVQFNDERFRMRLR